MAKFVDTLRGKPVIDEARVTVEPTAEQEANPAAPVEERMPTFSRV